MLTPLENFIVRELMAIYNMVSNRKPFLLQNVSISLTSFNAPSKMVCNLRDLLALFFTPLFRGRCIQFFCDIFYIACHGSLWCFLPFCSSLIFHFIWGCESVETPATCTPASSIRFRVSINPFFSMAFEFFTSHAETTLESTTWSLATSNIVYVPYFCSVARGITRSVTSYGNRLFPIFKCFYQSGLVFSLMCVNDRENILVSQSIVTVLSFGF